MKQINKFTFLLFLSAIALNSCTKNLDQEPVSFITVANFWKTPDDAKGALTGMYVDLRREASNDLFMMGEARSETMGPSITGVDAYTGAYYQNNLTKDNSYLDWNQPYKVIHDANLLLKYVPGIAFTSQAAKKSILAEAYTMRAYMYFVLTRTWGDLPLITEPTESYSPTTTQKSRSPKADIFTLIKSDLESALALFPDYNFQSGRCNWTKPSANALKADVYLWTGKIMNGGAPDFTTALSALNSIVDSADVSLLTYYDTIFRYYNKGNQEILMASRFYNIESRYNLYQHMYIYPAYIPSNADSASLAAIGTPGGYSTWSPSDTLVSQFGDDDLRKKSCVTKIYTTDGTTKTYFTSIVNKFKGFDDNPSGVRQFLDDYVIYRYADVLLMKAEAENALGQDPTNEINMIRVRAYGANYPAHVFVAASQDANDEAILLERLFEFTFEGKRWWDLVRFGKAFEKVPSLQGRAGQDYLMLFPITSNTLSLEPLVAQNPGY